MILCEHGAIRLEDGNSFYEGRVEVCFEDHWATICDHQWNKKDAEVVCKQLGHSGGITPLFLCNFIRRILYFILYSLLFSRM